MAVVVPATLGFFMRIGNKPNSVARSQYLVDLAIRRFPPKVMDLFFARIPQELFSIFALDWIGAHRCPLSCFADYTAIDWLA